MSTSLYRLGRWSALHPWRVIVSWLLAAIAVIGASAAWSAELSDSFSVPGTDSDRAVQLLSGAASQQAGVTARVVAVPRGGGAFDADPTATRSLDSLQAALAGTDGVLAVGNERAPDGRGAVLTVQYPVLEELDDGDLERLQAVVDRYADDPSLQVEAGGELYFHFAAPAGNSSELIGIAAAVVVLLIGFGSVIAMGLPIVTALVGLAIGSAAIGLLAHLVGIPSDAPGFAAMVGIGVGIDYALFLVTRHREFLDTGLPLAEAAGRTLATAGQAVAFAGGTVVVSILGLTVAGVPMVTATGVAVAVVVAMMVAASLTLVPALLGVCGPWINRLGVHRHRRRRAVTPAAVAPVWARWARRVARRPWPWAVGGTLLLLGLASPVVALNLGFPDDGTLPTSSTERRAYDLVTERFGAGVNGPLLIAVDLAGATGDTAPTLARLATAVGRDAGIAGVTAAPVAPGASVATLIAVPTTEPQADATYDTVERLRSDVFPAVLDGTGVTAHVGGATANFGDVAARVTDRLPLFVLTVVVLSSILLTIVFRSLLVPLKAALLNLLSIGAAYGVVVMVFQWGWGMSLIGLESTLPIVSLIPLFMFAVLFGLSMDYEVFLLSRIREEYTATGDNEVAVVDGITATARIITSAALVMVSVFGGFLLGTNPLLKMAGLGLATAILIDATVIRLVLVPATMTLLGDRNWWLPAWLDRRLPHLTIEGDAPAAASAPADRRVSH